MKEKKLKNHKTFIISQHKLMNKNSLHLLKIQEVISYFTKYNFNSKQISN